MLHTPVLCTFPVTIRGFVIPPTAFSSTRINYSSLRYLPSKRTLELIVALMDPPIPLTFVFAPLETLGTRTTVGTSLLSHPSTLVESRIVSRLATQTIVHLLVVRWPSPLPFLVGLLIGKALRLRVVNLQTSPQLFKIVTPHTYPFRFPLDKSPWKVVVSLGENDLYCSDSTPMGKYTGH